jgi:hypothetical protein
LLNAKQHIAPSPLGYFAGTVGQPATPRLQDFIGWGIAGVFISLAEGLSLA